MLPDSDSDPVIAAYLEMAPWLRPEAADGDGLGGRVRPVPKDVLMEEARRYASGFRREEDSNSYWAGCTDGRLVKAVVWTLEAMRLMNAGSFYGDDKSGATLVPRLLRMAMREYQAQMAGN